MSPKPNKATVSPSLRAFGKRFRSYREAKGWTQEAVAARANNGAGVKYQYIGAIENGRTRCSREFTEIMDRELNAGGELIALWQDLVKDAAFPTWFDWHIVENEALELTSYSLNLVHGLLQTPEYAEVLLYGDKKAVDGRMKRQEVLVRNEPPPPNCLFLIDEGVLIREVGRPEIMAEQCDALIDAISRKVTVQVVPMRGDHQGNISAFTLALLPDRRELAYTECAARGFTMEDADDINTQRQVLREIQSLALPVKQSIELIHQIKAGRWT
ncbi:helix-turn-helix transcriptional regulator [Actinomadura sp. PM05-2]|uniref:Helix-turn-helix transcriptional regulator n=2 Tax=Actinomadura parmotrematis TaxID=2864039 RepID=A0ABS7FUY9_9ACTN|nr:helix-turn-helix transcriptional regulator [Actinomadura parmotrematis]